MLLATNYLVCGWFTDKIWPAVVLNLFFISAQFSILSQGTTFNFLAIGGLLLVVAELGFMGEMEPRLVSELQLL